ncbi:hypothetical protein ACN42_g5845 [Penicillium freii]|uniref:Uncharacterized protein n=1 Tax=Penicillium freii TaxID=48697 RepID=A0A101MIP8_PENFR|nr:hypothetical protein ACN42_g5845 [Penicillium freii]
MDFFTVLRRVFGSPNRFAITALCLVVFLIVPYYREALVVPLRVKVSNPTEQSVDPFPSDYAGQPRLSSQVINDPYPHYGSAEWISTSKGPYQPCIGPQGRLLRRKDEDMIMSGFRWNTSGAKSNNLGMDGELIRG